MTYGPNDPAGWQYGQDDPDLWDNSKERLNQKELLPCMQYSFRLLNLSYAFKANYVALFGLGKASMALSVCLG